MLVVNTTLSVEYSRVPVPHVFVPIAMLPPLNVQPLPQLDSTIAKLPVGGVGVPQTPTVVVVDCIALRHPVALTQA
jgi:hypothetical protein